MSRPTSPVGLVVVLIAAAALLGAALVTPAIRAADPGAVAAKKKGKKKQKPISGKLSKRGYTVIAIARAIGPNGEAEAVRAKRGKFKLRPRAVSVTLQLRAPDGTYAGPIVVGSAKHGKRAILGIKAGAKLGKVKVKPRKGYAKPTRELARRSVDRRLTASAKKGVPIGAGNFGRVLVPKLKGTIADADRDRDGVPVPLDIDDDGDLILDNLDPTTATTKGKSAHASIGPGEYVVGGFSTLFTELFRTVNANAAGLSDAQIDAALPSFGYLTLGSISSPTGILQADPGTFPELDCGDPNTGLAYCRKNASTGKKVPLFAQGGPLSGESFPSCCDPDGDGFGTLDHVTVPPGLLHPMYADTLLHGAASTQVGSGDVLIERAMIGGSETKFPGSINFVFNTTPALISYSDGAGNSAAPSYPGAPAAPGNQGNGFPVADSLDDPDSDVELTLTFWRPQRKPIAQEAGNWIDLGHLTYSLSFYVPVPGGQRPTGGSGCPLSSYSESDPNLSPFVSTIGGPGSPVDTWRSGLRDSADDRPANPANTLTLTLNLSDCLASHGFPLVPGNDMGVSLAAVPANTLPAPAFPDQASTTVFFRPL